jgi:hypothetical protein
MFKLISILVLLLILAGVILTTTVTPPKQIVQKSKVAHEEEVDDYQKRIQLYKYLRSLIDSCEPVIIDHKLLQVCV